MCLQGSLGNCNGCRGRGKATAHTRLVHIVVCLFLRSHDAIRRTPHIVHTRHNQLAHIVKHIKATHTVCICIYISMCMNTYLSMCLHTCICISMEETTYVIGLIWKLPTTNISSEISYNYYLDALTQNQHLHLHLLWLHVHLLGLHLHLPRLHLHHP